MKNLVLGAVLAMGVALGSWSLPRAQADHPHCHGGGYGAGFGAGYGGYSAGYGGYGVGHLGHGHSHYSGSRVVYGYSGLVPGYLAAPPVVYRGGYAPYSPYGGAVNGIYGNGMYRSSLGGLGYSNFGVGPSIVIGGPNGGGIRIGL